MILALAVVLGFLFGLILQSVGAADPDRIVGMLRFTDLHLAKAISAGIGLASVLLFVALSAGLLDPAHISIKPLYIGVIVGGLVFGIGWAISGFCPGTGVVALGAGRLDALFFVIGGLLGAGAFARMYEPLLKTSLFREIFGGRVTLAQTGAADALVSGAAAPVLAVGIGIVFLIIAALLPQSLDAARSGEE